MTESKFLKLLKLHIFNTHSTQAEAARHWKVSNNFVSLVVNGVRRPTERMLEDVGIKLKVVTIKKYSRA